MCRLIVVLAYAVGTQSWQPGGRVEAAVDARGGVDVRRQPLKDPAVKSVTRKVSRVEVSSDGEIRNFQEELQPTPVGRESAYWLSGVLVEANGVAGHVLFPAPPTAADGAEAPSADSDVGLVFTDVDNDPGSEADTSAVFEPTLALEGGRVAVAHGADHGLVHEGHIAAATVTSGEEITRGTPAGDRGAVSTLALAAGRGAVTQEAGHGLVREGDAAAVTVTSEGEITRSGGNTPLEPAGTLEQARHTVELGVDLGLGREDELAAVFITSEEEDTQDWWNTALEPASTREPVWYTLESDVMRLGGGLGVTAYGTSPTGSRHENRELRRQLELQDFATVGLLFFVFPVTIMLSCLIAYQVAEDTSPVSFYSQRGIYRQRLICAAFESEEFLQVFNGSPQNARLRIIGRSQLPGGIGRVLQQLSDQYDRRRLLARILFDVALDLTPFIDGEGMLEEKEMWNLEQFVARDKPNKVEVMRLEKYVDWKRWEDVAAKIREKLKDLGFEGDVDVRFEACEKVLIYQNDQWANFVRSHVTQALVVLSVIGGLMWWILLRLLQKTPEDARRRVIWWMFFFVLIGFPYCWGRQKTVKVESRFRIDLEPEQYWDLVSEHLSATEGFNARFMHLRTLSATSVDSVWAWSPPARLLRSRDRSAATADEGSEASSSRAHSLATPTRIPGSPAPSTSLSFSSARPRYSSLVPPRAGRWPSH